MKQLAFFWGIGGILLLLALAVVRLSATAWNAFGHNLAWYHWLLLFGNLATMLYYEGYKGFQLAFSPRVAARARHLGQNGNFFDLLLAPLFCMAYYAAPKKRIIATWILTTAIVVLVILFQRLPQPVRGILDVGVVAGLSWGILATLYFGIIAWVKSDWDHDPELISGQNAAETLTKSET